MNNLDFCCSRFETDWNLNRNIGLNIRIVKFIPSDMGNIPNEEFYRFFVTCGYNENENPKAHLNIAYCPYCGVNLFDKYNNDCYINEDKKYFLMNL